MSQKDLKKLLCAEIELNQNLHQFCIDCLTKIYGELARDAINLFVDDVESWEYCGCVQPLEYLDKRLMREVQESKERAEKFKKESQE